MIKKTEELELHESTADFPMASDDEMAALEADIKENGILEPVKVIDDKIVDGRHRFMAARKLGIGEIPVEIVTTDNLPLYVMSLNLNRRHLNPGQKALIVNDYLGVASDPENGKQKRRKGKLADIIAQMAGVGATTVKTVLYVLKNGEESDIQALRDGKMTANEVKKAIMKRNRKPSTRSNSTITTSTHDNTTTSEYKMQLERKNSRISELEAQNAQLLRELTVLRDTLLQMEENVRDTSIPSKEELKSDYIKGLEDEVEKFRKTIKS